LYSSVSDKPLIVSMSNYVVQKFLTCLVLGLTLSLQDWKADAAILGSETPNSFSLSLDSNDFPPIDGPGTGLDWYHNWTLFDGQYWNVKTYAQTRGGRVFNAQYVVPNPSANSYARLIFQAYITPFDPQIDPNPENIQSSYLVHSPPSEPSNVLPVQCEKGSPDCTFFELLHSPVQVLGLFPSTNPVSVEINGFYEPPDNPKSVPEPSTEIGSFAALGILAFKLFQRRLTQGKSHNI
jgi:hypothetical protein